MISNLTDSGAVTTYPINVLQEVIPLADIADLQRISTRMQDEQGLYNNREYHKMLMLLSDRLIKLSREKRSI